MKLASAIVALAVAGGAIAATLAVHAERESDSTAVAFKQDPRLDLWPEIVERIQERPLLGHGFGRGGLRAELREELGDGLLWHAHNLVLETLVQGGVPALGLLLLLLAATAREAWRLSRQSNDTAIACGIALAAVLAGMLARNMTDVLWVRQNALAYWGVVGTLLGLAAHATRSRAA
jgi:O-antigen ligase